MPAAIQPVSIFFSYAHEDEDLKVELDKQLSLLKRQGLIDVWHDRDINAGEEWKQEINRHLNEADIILLLVSSDFMASDYCYSIEMKRAMERYERKEASVIPVILRPADWEAAPFSRLQVLPRDAVPVTVTDDKRYGLDKAFTDVAKGIRAVVENQIAKNEAKQCIRLGDEHYDQEHYVEALATYEQAIKLDPNLTIAYENKSLVLFLLKRYQEALQACEQAIKLDPNLTGSANYNFKGLILLNLEKYGDALASFEQAIRLDPNQAAYHYNKALVLCHFERYDDALVACEQAVRLDPNDDTYRQAREDIRNHTTPMAKLGRQLGRFVASPIGRRLLMVATLSLRRI